MQWLNLVIIENIYFGNNEYLIQAARGLRTISLHRFICFNGCFAQLCLVSLVNNDWPRILRLFWTNQDTKWKHSTGTGKPFPSLTTGNSVFVVRLVKRIRLRLRQTGRACFLETEKTMSDVEREIAFQPWKPCTSLCSVSRELKQGRRQRQRQRGRQKTTISLVEWGTIIVLHARHAL